VGIAAEPSGSVNGVAKIGNRPATPAANLIAENAQPAGVAAPDGAGGDNAAVRAVSVRRRGDLDRVAIAVELDDERRVIKVASSPMLAKTRPLKRTR